MIAFISMAMAMVRHDIISFISNKCHLDNIVGLRSASIMKENCDWTCQVIDDFSKWCSISIDARGLSEGRPKKRENKRKKNPSKIGRGMKYVQTLSDREWSNGGTSISLSLDRRPLEPFPNGTSNIYETEWKWILTENFFWMETINTLE